MRTQNFHLHKHKAKDYTAEVMMRYGVFIILAVVLLGGLFYLFSPKPQVVKQSTTSSSVTAMQSKPLVKKFSLVTRDNMLVSGDKLVKVTEGDTVMITIKNNADDEFHIHGYDKELEIKKDTPASVTFKATLTGRFPMELHGADVEVAQLEVDPK